MMFVYTIFIQPSSAALSTQIADQLNTYTCFLYTYMRNVTNLLSSTNETITSELIVCTTFAAHSCLCAALPSGRGAGALRALPHPASARPVRMDRCDCCVHVCVSVCLVASG